MASGASARTSSTVIASLRTTSTVVDERADQMHEVPGEAVVIVDDEDAGHGAATFAQGDEAAVKARHRSSVAHWPNRARLAKRTASSAARNSALALLTHSCCSEAGSES